MKLLNDDFKNIVNLFECAITKELKIIKNCAKYYKDNKLVGQVDEILKSDDIIFKISSFRDEDNCLENKFRYNQTKREYAKYSVKLSAHINSIFDLIHTFAEFNEVLNKNEKDKITIKTAIYFIENMNFISEFIEQEVDNMYGISLLNAAGAYQYIANVNTEFTSKEMDELKYKTKHKWKHSLKLDPIGKGKNGAYLYDLSEMVDFVCYIENNNFTNRTNKFRLVKRINLQNEIKKLGEEIES